MISKQEILSRLHEEVREIKSYLDFVVKLAHVDMKSAQKKLQEITWQVREVENKVFKLQMGR